MKLKLIATFVLCSFGLSVQPLSENSAKWGAAGGSAALGAATGAFMYCILLGKHSGMGSGTRLVMSGIAALASGGFTWSLLDQFLNSMTPTGRFSAAHKMISLADMDSVVARNFNSESELLNHTNARFGTSWPLIRAQDHLILIRTNLLHAITLLNITFNESEGKNEYGDLPQRCLIRKRKALETITTIEGRLSSISCCKDYNFQANLYTKYLEKEREDHVKNDEKIREEWHSRHEKDPGLKQNVVVSRKYQD